MGNDEDKQPGRRVAQVMRCRERGVALVAIMAAGVAAAVEPPAEVAFTGGKIYTADPTRSMAEALAVRGGRIVYVGSSAGVRAYIGPGTKVEKLQGRLVLPGLIDSHIHPIDIVDSDTCDLKSVARSLRELTDFVRACIVRYRIPEGQWVSVQQWNFSDGNVPDAAHPTLRAALDLASARHPIQLLGNDGHHGAFNSMALARARNSAGNIVGYSKSTLDGDFRAFSKLVGVDASGEPNGTINENARRAMDTPSWMELGLYAALKDPGRITARLNSVGITGMLDAAVGQPMLAFYDALEKGGRMTVRASLAQYYDPDVMSAASGKPDWDRMLALAQSTRARYAHDPLIRAETVKLLADGILEGNPYAVPPTLPEVGATRPYRQPIFRAGKGGRMSVVGYVDTASALCGEVRAHPERFDAADATAAFMRKNGYHPDQCTISSGQLQHDPAVIMEFVKRFHLAGFGVHVHTVGDLAVRTALDAIEAARAAGGDPTLHDALAHVQLVNPADAARIGRDRLYVAFTFGWAVAEDDYDLSVVPFIDEVHGSGIAALHPANGYYENNAYPARALKAAGAVLLGGSDAPVDSRDPRPFVHMAVAVTRRIPGKRALNPSEGISIREAIDAYTINGAKYLNFDRDAGSIEVGKSADLVIVDRDILALADGGKPDAIVETRVLQTWFMGREVYRRADH